MENKMSAETLAQLAAAKEPNKMEHQAQGSNEGCGFQRRNAVKQKARMAHLELGGLGGG